MFIYIYMILHENKKERKKLKICNKQKNVHFRNKNPKNLTRGLKTAIMAKNDRRKMINVDCRFWISHTH